MELHGFITGKHKPPIVVSSSGIGLGKSLEQIFIQCCHPGCEDSAAIFPRQLHSIDQLTDHHAANIFNRMGWTVKGHGAAEKTLCPDHAPQPKFTKHG